MNQKLSLSWSRDEESQARDMRSVLAGQIHIRRDGEWRTGGLFTWGMGIRIGEEGCWYMVGSDGLKKAEHMVWTPAFLSLLLHMPLPWEQFVLFTVHFPKNWKCHSGHPLFTFISEQWITSYFAQILVKRQLLCNMTERGTNIYAAWTLC